MNYNASMRYGIPVIDEFYSNTRSGKNLFNFFTIHSRNVEIQRYIINEGATIIFWNDGTKTISKRHKEDKFDKEIGFLFAYFYKKYKGSKASRKRVIDSIDYKKIKTFLFEFYVNDIGEDDYEKARKYLSNLKVEK